MAGQSRDQRFLQSLRDWGQVFMLTIWLQSIMTAAIATKSTGKSKRVKVLSNEYREKRNDLMKQGLAKVWQDFVREYPGEISKQESHTVDMIILIRNQLAHCHIVPGNEFALFLPAGSQNLLEKLKSAGSIETPSHPTSNPEMLIMMPEGISGLVWVGDMLPTSVCPASNAGELMRLERSWVEHFARVLASTLVHEAQHINSVYKRLLNTLEDPFAYDAQHDGWGSRKAGPCWPRKPPRGSPGRACTLSAGYSGTHRAALRDSGGSQRNPQRSQPHQICP